jgi:probable HAF family extracellular repeat protein
MTYSYTTLNEGTAYGINDAGQIVGNGYLFSSGTYITLHDPLGRVATTAYGINNAGQIVGSYQEGHTFISGFLYSGGAYTDIYDPLDIGGTTSGNDFSQGIISHGFLYNAGTYITLDDPLATLGTVASGINDAGQIVGTYKDATFSHGFLYSAGTYTTLDDPLATAGTSASGINDAGQIVGSYTDGTGTHSFLYSAGTYTTLDDPMASSAAGGTSASGINDAGQIVGYYGDPTGNHGFLAATKTSVERFFDSATGDHFYTLSTAEAAQIRATLPTYHDEGAPWSATAAGPDTQNVYRFFDVITRGHFLTDSAVERDHINNTPSLHAEYQDEGVAFQDYTAAGPGTFALERFFNTISHMLPTARVPLRTLPSCPVALDRAGWMRVQGLSCIVRRTVS